MRPVIFLSQHKLIAVSIATVFALLVALAIVGTPAVADGGNNQEALGVEVEHDVDVIKGTERTVAVDGALRLEASQSNSGFCLHVRVGEGAFAGGCGFESENPEKSWMTGALGSQAFAAGVAPDGVSTVEVDLADGSTERTFVDDGSWMVLLPSDGVLSIRWLDIDDTVVTTISP